MAAQRGMSNETVKAVSHITLDEVNLYWFWGAESRLIPVR